MRIKTLFNIPDGEKVTEKALRRVLISSVCSILLCMSCLFGTTWAWFTVSIQNTGNIIEIATVTPNVTITNSAGTEIIKSADNGYVLNPDTYSMNINLDNTATAPDDLNDPSRSVYVLISVTHGSDPHSYYLTCNNGNNVAAQTIDIRSGSATVYFSVSWVEPDPVTSQCIDTTPVILGEISANSETEPSSASGTENTEQPSTTQTDPSINETTAATTEVIESTSATSAEETSDPTEAVTESESVS